MSDRTGSLTRNPSKVVSESVPATWWPVINRAFFYLSLGFIVLLLAFPIFWMFSSALRPQSELFTQSAKFLPGTVSFEHYLTLVNLTDFGLYYMNSVVISLGVVTLTTVLSTLGGYGLSRVDIPFKIVFARGVLFGYMFPAILLGIPMFIIWRNLGLLNSYIGVILAITALSLPFSLWLMWKFFQTIPESLEEAGRVMGTTRFGTFYDIALPMAKPGMMAVAIFSFAVSWNAYTIPKILITDRSSWVLTIAVDQFIQAESISWGPIMAASSLMLIPAFVFVYFLQTYILRGFKAGGIG
jgi:multiple sugar transport system permease protein